METLFAKQDRILALTSTEIIRTLMRQINWDAQLVAIRGPRGVGQTTLMLQYIKVHYEVYKRICDFKINGRYTLEVGGEGKTYDQIADLPDSYILADGIETPYRCKLPIWIVGFLY